MDSNSWLSAWEVIEYSAEGAVIVGALGEFVAEFTDWIRPPPFKKRVERVAAVVLIVGLAIEVLATANVNDISNQQIAALNLEAAKDRKAAAVAIDVICEQMDAAAECAAGLSALSPLKP